MFCDICGYKGEVDKNDPKYLVMFDLKMKDQVPEQYVNSLRELQFCSKCRKLLLGFIDTKRIENGLNPILEHKNTTFLDTWKAMSNEKKAFVRLNVEDAQINGTTSSPEGKATMEHGYNSLKEKLTDDEISLLGYCRDKQDLPWSIKTYEKEKKHE